MLTKAFYIPVKENSTAKPALTCALATAVAFEILSLRSCALRETVTAMPETAIQNHSISSQVLIIRQC
jgi:hypothetical protein